MLYLIFSEEGGKKRMTPFMEWNLNCLRAIAELRTPLLDTLMQGVTELGGETLFMLFMLVVFWCVDKNKGYFLMLLCFTGTAVNQMLKITFCIPRPWVLDPSFEIVESARAGATGFSFPSGHTQNAVGTLGGIAITPRAEVLDRHGRVIPRLYAAGEVTGGVHGANYMGGNALSEVFTFGRIAGENAVQEPFA